MRPKKELKTLKENPNIKTINLTSWGGYISAAVEMADIIIDFDEDFQIKNISTASLNFNIEPSKFNIVQNNFLVDIEESYKISHLMEGWLKQV